MNTFDALKHTLPRTRGEAIDDAWLPEESNQASQPLEELPAATGILPLTELILKNPPLLERLIRFVPQQATLIPQLMLISFLGFLLYGVTMGGIIGVSGWTPHLNAPRLVLDSNVPLIEFHESHTAWAAWRDGTAPSLIVAYAIGLIAATGICLPSLYFYGLLSGIKLTMRDVVIHSLKSKAGTAIALLGILPIYFIVCLGAVIFHWPKAVIVVVQWIGFALPFFAGQWGVVSLYRGFSGLADTLPAHLNMDDRYRRSCFLERLVLAWSVCYSVISPIMVFTIWQRMQ